MHDSNFTNNIDYSFLIEDLEGYAIYELDLNGNIISWNDNAERVKGYDKEEILGKKLYLFFPKDELENNTPDKLLLKARKEGKAQSQGWRKKKNGTLFWAKTVLKLKKGKNNEPIGFIKLTRDLTQQKELERSNERGRIFVEQTPHAMAMFDLNMNYLAASKKWREDYNLGDIPLIGKSHYEIFPEISEEWKQIHQDCLNGAINICDEAAFERKDGTTQWLKWDVRPWYYSEKNIGGILMYTEDITDRKNLFEKLNINTQQFRGAFENSPIGMAIVSLEGQWVDVNKELCHTLGYTEKELLLKTFQDITHPEDLEKDLNLLKKTIEGEINTYQMEKRYFHKDGHIIWAMLSVSLVRDERNIPLHFVSMIEDINKRKIAEEKLIEVNIELTAILNSTHVSIIGTDLDGTITSFNKGAEELLGYTAEEMIQKHSPSIIHKMEEVVERGEHLSKIYNKKIEGFDVFVEKARQGEFESREWTYIKKDGTEFKVQLVVTSILNPEGEINGFLGVATDITSLVEAKKDLETSKKELEILAEKLTKQNKQLLDFAHITSHNLRAPVSNLHALLDIYKNADDETTKIEVFGHLNHTVENLSNTLDQLMTSLKVQKDASKELEELDIVLYVDKVTRSVSNEIKKLNAIIETDFTAFQKIKYNKIYLESILQNLITNALRYHSPERAPIIKLKTEINNGKKTLSVEDNGLGMDLKRYGNKVFGLYKTFHRNKKARGVGLFITKTQVEAMGGNIFVKSNLNQGTIFYIEFNKK